MVDFWAPSCSACRMMGPVFDRAAARLEPYTRFGKVNTEADPSVVDRYEVMTLPTIVLFKNGREIERLPGAVDYPSFIRWLQSRL